MRELEIFGGTVIVDDADYERVAAQRWYVMCPRHISDDLSYAAAKINGRRVLMHRFLCDAADGIVIDHINRNGLDNRRSNLRPCTRAENLRNRKRGKNNTSGFKGVYQERGRWRAQINIGGRRFHLGSYKSAELAHSAYVTAAQQLHGEFARFN
jgi:hypothetical protein